MCHYDQADEIAAGEWVRVLGIIEKVQYGEQIIPVIVAQEVELTDKHENDYIYPF